MIVIEDLWEHLILIILGGSPEYELEAIDLSILDHFSPII